MAQPDGAQWRGEKYRLLIALDRPKDLEAELRRWTAGADVDNRWRLVLGTLLAEQGKVADAIKLFEAVETEDELSPGAYRMLADWYLVENRREQHEKAGAAFYKTASASGSAPICGRGRSRAVCRRSLIRRCCRSSKCFSKSRRRRRIISGSCTHSIRRRTISASWRCSPTASSATRRQRSTRSSAACTRCSPRSATKRPPTNSSPASPRCGPRRPLSTIAPSICWSCWSRAGRAGCRIRPAPTPRRRSPPSNVQATDTYFHEKDRWNEGPLASLASSCLENQLYAQSVTYYGELIPLHQRTQPRRGIGNGTLSTYYSQAAQAYAGLGKTREAVDMASGAVVSWGSRQDMRAHALETLVRVLVAAPDLAAHMAELDNRSAVKAGRNASATYRRKPASWKKY